MKKEYIEQRLSSAVSQIAPKDGFEKLSKELDSVSENERTVIKMTDIKNKSYKKYLQVAIAACLILVIGLMGGNFYGNNIAVDSVIDIDVNPSIELATNKQEKVVKVTAVNEDAIAILDGMELKNTDLKVAVNAIIGSMVKNGYFDQLDNEILVTVKNDDEAKAEKLHKMLAVDIDETLKTYNVEASVINQTISDSKSAEELAKAYNISLGKANFIQNLVSKDKSLKAEDLAKMSIRELASVVTEKNIDISDIADYEADDSIWENIEDSIEEVDENQKPVVNPNKNENNKPNNNNTTAPENVITAEKAKEIALKHAGVSADKAVFEIVYLDKDDGIYEYEVDFRVGNIEYDYEINAVSGKIIDFERDYERNNSNSNQQPNEKPDDNTSNGTPNNTPSNTSQISAEKAKEIALSHAGLSKDKVSFIKAEYDREDNSYEVEFVYEKMDYEYDIHAESGKILDFEKERADFD